VLGKFVSEVDVSNFQSAYLMGCPVLVAYFCDRAGVFVAVSALRCPALECAFPSGPVGLDFDNSVDS